MNDLIIRMAEEKFGIKADLSDVEKLCAYIEKKYGNKDQESVDKVFLSGEAAGFLTVNETYFFREPVHFDFLLEMLPAYEHSGIRICSAATSTGCEAYSIAMLIEAYNKKNSKQVFYRIDAFDINGEVIKTALQGIYGERSMREDGSSFHYAAEPFLTKLEHGYQADISLQKKINFFVHNLMEPFSNGIYDLIFFRNAFIYFSKAARLQVLSNLSDALVKGGLLFLGVSETAGVHHKNLESKNRIVRSSDPKNSGIGQEIFYFQKI